MSDLRIILTTLVSAFVLISSAQEKVGLVLSGGGANGLAHIGAIRALEENNIPIDYITGTSSGSFVGAMYAAGYSPDEIEEFFLSEEFEKMVVGEISRKDRFFYKESEANASMLRLRISKDFSLSNSLPTNIISPAPVDFKLMELFGGVSAAADYCFDSLLIPFRCVAADIEEKEEYILSDGDLGVAVRASFTYPFYIQPIRVNERLLFDGGLYNNFPHDIMRSSFDPDYIIGVKVTSNDPPPSKSDLISQVKSMLISKTDFDLQGPGTIIEPVTNHGTFEFKNLKEIIDSGYAATLRAIPEIQQRLKSRRQRDKVEYERLAFKSKVIDYTIKKASIEGVNSRKSRYLKKSLWRRQSNKTLSQVRKRYFQTLSDKHISSMFPSLHFDEMDQLYSMSLDAEPEKPFVAEFGGVFSNRPISTGYVGLEYNPWGKRGWSLKGNTYFGRFYNSAMGSIRLDIPSKLPFYLEGFITFNSWNYFKSKSFFFDEDRPSYLIQKENYGGFEIGTPLGNVGKLSLSYSYAEMNDEYYQDKSFTSDDIPDLTTLRPNSTKLELEINTHNRILYANEGLQFKLMGRYSVGDEETNPGTTSQGLLGTSIIRHEWVDLSLLLDYYYFSRKVLKLGVYSESNYSNIKPFTNYTASILKSPAFQPTPESKTLFLESFRAYQYTSIGQKLIVSVVKNIDWRTGVYFFLPYEKVIRDETDMQQIELGFNNVFSIANTGLVYNSPVGPLSVGINYYYNVPEIAPEDEFPLTFLFHFGYIIFNRKALY